MHVRMKSSVHILQANAKTVHGLSEGRIGYVHIPDMVNMGFVPRC